MRPPKRQRTLTLKGTIATRPAQQSAPLADGDGPLGDPNPGASGAASVSRTPRPESLSPQPQPPPGPREKTRKSWVYHHMPDEDPQTYYVNEMSGKGEWRCRYCTKTYLLSGSTSGPGGHLEEVHALPRDSPRTTKAANITYSLETAFAQAAANPQKRRRPDTTSIDQDQLEVLWVRCLVSCNLSFRMIENTEFRAFIKYLNPDAEELLAKDHSTIREWVIRQYAGLKTNTILPLLQNARTKIHISCDLWTSPNALSILGICAQFIDASGQLQSLVLALKEMDGHAGVDLAKVIYDVVCEYKIIRNLGYFVMDNAPDNDTMMHALASLLRKEFKIVYNAIHHRIRCQGHILNLAVKSFLFVTEEESIDEDTATNVYTVTLKEIEQWRRKGPLGKLHNFVVRQRQLYDYFEY